MKAHLRNHGFLIEAPTHGRLQSDGSITSTLSLSLSLSLEQQQANVDRSTKKWVVDSVSPFSAAKQMSFVNMIRTLIPMLTVPGRHKVRRLTLARDATLQEKVHLYLHASGSTISLTCEAWSGCVFRGYMAVSAQWIDNYWNMRGTIIDFVRFRKPHTEDAPWGTSHDIVSK